MNKSFYYVINVKEATFFSKKLTRHSIPHSFETGEDFLALPAHEISVLFPDLPIRQYDIVHKMFGGTGKPVPQ
ncbi:hypothetical protein [Brevibacillus brevis]|uniref:Uncharacterized protein n=1 Tax=Brevibacillus brevis TaxID=1393 RepID=A0ABY9TCS0_BREBE|nr:hypothetical protein [Brevibacillus brevis]WNC17881.1 hypothetical protein RGB73_30395 [Brevibacillus brevis]